MGRRDGGPAFPRIDGIEDAGMNRQSVIVTGGMSLRDWFAGQALAGWGEGHHGESYRIQQAKSPAEDLPGYADRMAAFAYAVADAMLEARES